jgi:predicted outer membrane repeat protein
MNIISSVVSGNTAANDGGGIDNYNAQMAVSGMSRILSNQATTGYGGGIQSTNNLITLDGTGVSVKSNKAHMPSALGSNWYQGWGVYIDSGVPTTKNGFNPTTQVTGNTHI